MALGHPLMVRETQHTHHPKHFKVNSSTLPFSVQPNYRRKKMSQSSPLLESSSENRASVLTANSPNTSWNLSLVIASIVILSVSTNELPNRPLRAWIIVFAVIHFVEVIVKILQGVSQVFAFVWWIIGVVWILSGSHPLRENAPILYWSTVVFLAFRLLVLILICVAIPICCCCLPFIIAGFSSEPNQESVLESSRSVDVEAPVVVVTEEATTTESST